MAYRVKLSGDFPSHAISIYYITTHSAKLSRLSLYAIRRSSTDFWLTASKSTRLVYKLRPYDLIDPLDNSFGDIVRTPKFRYCLVR